MANPVTPNGAISFTVEAGKTLTLTPSSGAKGSIAIFTTASTVELVDQIGSAAKTYGPYAAARNCRLYAESGTISYDIAGSVAALSLPGAPIISADGLTISGSGVKPTTTVPVYDVDTGLGIGQTISLADGSWSLSLKTALKSGTRIGYDPVIVGPYVVMGTVTTGTGTGTGTGSTGSGSTYTPPPDPAIAASSAQASSANSERTAAASDTGRSGSGAGPYTALTRPTIVGKHRAGQTLVGYPGLWDAAAGLTYSWTVNGVAVTGQNSRSYTVQTGDVGKAIAFVVTPNAGTAASSQPITINAEGPALLLEDGTNFLLEDGTNILLDERVLRWNAPYSASSSRLDKLADPKVTAYGYAVTDADIFVGPDKLPVSLYAPGCKIVNLWHSGKSQLSLVPDADGFCAGVLPLTGLANGPLWIEAHALVDNTTESLAISAIYAGINVIIRGGVAPTIPATPTAAAGLTLTFEDKFDSALSASQANTRPSGTKWYGSMAFDKNGYGDAIFADPNGAASPFSIVDGLLRIRCSYNPTLAASLNDPYNRKWIGGCLTSSFPDGSTSVPGMGNGYYECRMLCPVGIGTWPAFWLNDQQSLLLKAAGTPTPNGRETDIVEQYNETFGYVATQHRYQKDANNSNIDKSTGFNVAADKGRMGWAWHRFGALVTDSSITYYLDDQVVAVDNSKYRTAPSGQPDLDHIILTMAMNGGWPVAVPPSGYYDLYTDYVRYWK